MKYADFLARERFSLVELVAIAEGSLVDDGPDEFFRLPSPPLLMLSRVTEIERRGSRGRIAGELDVDLDHWFFLAHFRGDPVMPGALGVDGVWQLLALFAAGSGAPGSGRALGCKEVDFFGSIRPHDQVMRYEVEIRRCARLEASGLTVAIGSAEISIDGVPIYRIKDARVGMLRGIRYSDYPRPSENSRGGVMDRDES